MPTNAFIHSELSYPLDDFVGYFDRTFPYPSSFACICQACHSPWCGAVHNFSYQRKHSSRRKTNQQILCTTTRIRHCWFGQSSTIKYVFVLFLCASCVTSFISIASNLNLPSRKILPDKKLTFGIYKCSTKSKGCVRNFFPSLGFVSSIAGGRTCHTRKKKCSNREQLMEQAPTHDHHRPSLVNNCWKTSPDIALKRKQQSLFLSSANEEYLFRRHNDALQMMNDLNRNSNDHLRMQNQNIKRGKKMKMKQSTPTKLLSHYKVPSSSSSSKLK